MTGTTPWQAQDSIEPIAAATIGAIANMALYNVVTGVDATYSAANLQITYAAGSVTHNSTATTVAGNTVTLVADPTNPRWTYSYVNSSGTAAIVSGSAAATPAVPDPGANVTVQLTYVQAGLTIADNATYKLDKRVMAVVASTTNITGLTQKYKSATQTVSASTTFADVTASSGTFSFAIGANEVWSVRYLIPLTFTSTGGAKFQLTGPAAPTAVTITPLRPAYIDATTGVNGWLSEASTAAFSTAFANSAAGAISGALYNTAVAGSPIIIEATIANGANAGTVTLQVAQNSAAGTAVLGVGSKMIATRMA